MAKQLKKLTRAQKILLTKVKDGNGKKVLHPEFRDLDTLLDHGLIKMDKENFVVACPEPEPELAGTKELNRLQEKFNG